MIESLGTLSAPEKYGKTAAILDSMARLERRIPKGLVVSADFFSSWLSDIPAPAYDFNNSQETYLDFLLEQEWLILTKDFDNQLTMEILKTADSFSGSSLLVFASALDNTTILPYFCSTSAELIDAMKYIQADNYIHKNKAPCSIVVLACSQADFRLEPEWKSAIAFKRSIINIDNPYLSSVFDYGQSYNRLLRPASPFEFLMTLDKVTDPFPANIRKKLQTLTADIRKNSIDEQGDPLPNPVFSDSLKVRQLIGRSAAEGSEQGYIYRNNAGDNNNPLILITNGITKPDLQKLDRILGIIMPQGAVISYTAHIARSRNIPCIVGVKKTEHLPEGAFVSINGDSGIITQHEIV